MPVVMSTQPKTAQLPPVPSQRKFRQTRAIDTTTPANNASDLGGDGPTSEEMAAIMELAKKVSSGQYVLNSENPFVRRTLNESVTNHLAELVPGIISTRANYLSDLGVSPDTISRLTNHAAKIAEASLRYGVGFDDLQTAKALYISKVKNLLTPEQYDAYENLEKQQAVANQTDIKLSNFSPEDARSLVQLYESLGIDPVKASFLPYEGLPGLIGGGPEVTNVYQRRIARLESAREALDAATLSNQYSPEVVSSLRTFFDSQVNQDRESIFSIQNRKPRFNRLGPSVGPP